MVPKRMKKLSRPTCATHHVSAVPSDEMSVTLVSAIMKIEEDWPAWSMFVPDSHVVEIIKSC